MFQKYLYLNHNIKSLEELNVPFLFFKQLKGRIFARTWKYSGDYRFFCSFVKPHTWLTSRGRLILWPQNETWLFLFRPFCTFWTLPAFCFPAKLPFWAWNQDQSIVQALLCQLHLALKTKVRKMSWKIKPFAFPSQICFQTKLLPFPHSIFWTSNLRPFSEFHSRLKPKLKPSLADLVL